MTAYRKPEFRGQRTQTRADEALLLADGDATCWLSLQEYECLRVTLEPATLQTKVIAEGPGDKFPVPNCEPTAPRTCDIIVKGDIKVENINGCFVLETKHGGEKDEEASCWKTWENDGSPILDADENPVCVTDAFDKMKRFVRIRATKLGSPTFVRVKVLRGADTQ